jgi:hypothetical protein
MDDPHTWDSKGFRQCARFIARTATPRIGDPSAAVAKRRSATPPAIEFAWKLHEHRRYLRYVGIAFTVAALAIVLWRPWETFYFFSPANVSECREQAARTARSNDAMRVLLSVCYSKFPSN